MAIVGSVALPLALTACAVSGYDARLTRYPWLTDATGSSATVTFATTTAIPQVMVTYGAGPACADRSITSTAKTSIKVGTVTEYQWRLTLGSLNGGSYCYRIYGSANTVTVPNIDLLGASTASPTFHSEPSGSFGVIGDWGYDGNGDNSAQAGIINQMASSGATFALSTGDIGYNDGSQTNYGDLAQTGANVSAVFGPNYWPVAGAALPMFPVPGNHGANTALLTNWPESATAQASGGRTALGSYVSTSGSSSSMPDVWYAFNVSGWRVYVLTTEWASGNSDTQYSEDFHAHWAAGAAELAWLTNDLLTHPGPKIAAFHYPLYSANATEHSDTQLQGPGGLEGLLGRHGVRLVLNGHAHIYERNNPNNDGLVSIVTGGGGATLEPVTACNIPFANGGSVAYARGWSYSNSTGSACGSSPRPSSAAEVSNWVKVSLTSSTASVAAYDSNGNLFDSTSVSAT